MPFTFSHPAIILPLKYLPKNWFSLTGLIIGSLVPDFEYFIRMKVKSYYSHTLYGIFWFDVPLAILLAFIFHNIIRNDLFINSPRILKSRIYDFSQFNWNNYFKTNWIVVIFSIIIGTASHIFWDNFTHDHGYFVNNISELKNSVFLFGKEIPILKMAQHLSSLIGAIIILFTILKLPKNDTLETPINKNYWITIIVFILIIMAIRFMSGLNHKQYGHIIVPFLSATIISLIITPFFLNIKATGKNQQNQLLL